MSNPMINLGDGIEIPITKVYSNATDVSQPKTYKIFSGSTETVLMPYPATSFSNSQLIFNVNLPSKRALIDRRMYIQTNFSATITSVAPGLAINLNAYTYGLRQMPVTSCTTNCSIDLDNSRFSYAANDTVHALSWFGNNELLRRSYNSSGAGMPDMFQSYVGNAVRNPSIAYGTNPLEETRNVFNYLTSIVTTDNTAPIPIVTTYPITPDYADLQPFATALNASNIGGATIVKIVLNFQTTEPVLVPPLISGMNDEPALTGLSTMQVSYVMGNLSRLMSGFPTSLIGAISNIVYNINGSTLLTRIYTPHFTYPLKEINCYSTYNIVRYTTLSNPISANGMGYLPGSTGQITSQNIPWSGHPKYVMAFVRTAVGNLPNTAFPTSIIDPNVMSYQASYTDTFCTISSVQVLYNNKVIIANAQQQQLYQIAVRNGINMTQSQFFGHVGSVLCFSPSFDFSLPPGEGNGVSMPDGCLFQIIVNFQRPVSAATPAAGNTAGALPFTGPIPVPVELVVVAISEGILWNDRNGTFKTEFSPVTKSQCLEAPIELGAYSKYYNVFGSGYPGDVMKNIVSHMGKKLGHIMETPQAGKYMTRSDLKNRM